MAKELTLRQKKAVENLLANGSTQAQAIRDAGYADSMARQPHKVFKSKGVMQACEEAGLTRDFIAKAIQKDIVDKENVAPEKRNRTAELRLAAQITQMMEDDDVDKSFNFSQININVTARD